MPTNQLKRVFLQLAKGFKDEGTVGWLQSDMASGAHGARWPRDEEFRLAWQSYRVYIPSRIDRCKLILEALEEHHKHKEPAELINATIEHVMPRTLNAAWLAMLGDSADDVHAQHLHTIGNLTLTGYNSELSNSPFTEKKALLAESHFELNKHFAGHEKWGAGLDHRQVESPVTGRGKSGRGPPSDEGVTIPSPTSRHGCCRCWGLSPTARSG